MTTITTTATKPPQHQGQQQSANGHKLRGLSGLFSRGWNALVAIPVAAHIIESKR